MVALFLQATFLWASIQNYALLSCIWPFLFAINIYSYNLLIFIDITLKQKIFGKLSVQFVSVIKTMQI